MRYFFQVFLVISILIFASSCRKDFDFPDSKGDLSFSKDTIFLDTVFTNIGSSTYTLKVYNKSTANVQIPTVNLAQGQESKYRLNVDGVPGKSFNNVPLFAKDSLYIFIETTFDVTTTNQNEFLYTDAILFDVGERQQKVELVTLVKDAIFLFPSVLANGIKETIVLDLDKNGEEIKVEGFELEQNQLHFTNQKPYVIYGYAAVPDGESLRIDAGSRVYFHKDSGILVQGGAKIHINGELSTDKDLLEKEVIFEGDRLEPSYNNTPGQWGAIWISEGSTNNTINHLTVQNATIGLYVKGNGILNTPTLTLTNSQIYNSSDTNLWAISAKINAENTVLANAGNTSLYCSLGGTYNFGHCTIANYWIHGFRTGAALNIDNFSSNSSFDLLAANFTNSSIVGSNSIEMFLSSNNVNVFNYNFTNCLIDFNDRNSAFSENPLYDFESVDYIDNLFNIETGFENTSQNQFALKINSAAINRGNLAKAQEIPLDILGQNRTVSPDIGAYEFQSEN